jgi:hypothetical protein
MTEFPWSGKYLTVGGRYYVYCRDYVYCRAAGSIRSSCLQPVTHGTPRHAWNPGRFAHGRPGDRHDGRSVQPIGVDVPEPEVEANR